MKTTPLRSLALTGLVCVAALLVTLLALNAAVAAPIDSLGPNEPAAPSGEIELLVNGDFSSGFNPWWATGNVPHEVTAGVMSATVPSGAANPWDALIGQNDILIQNGGHYTLTVVAWASTNVTVPIIAQQNGGSYTTYFGGDLHLATTPQTFTLTFTSSHDDAAAGFQFRLGGLGEFQLFVDSVSLRGPAAPPPVSGVELLTNGDFGSGFDPWWKNGVTETVAGGILTAEVPSGAANPWDALIGQNGVLIQNGGHYTLTVVAWASTNVTVPVIAQENGGANTTYFGGDLPLTTSPQTFVLYFTSSHDDPAAGFQFRLGGLGAFTLYVDSVSLRGPAAPPPPQPSVELLTNGDFSCSFEAWWKNNVTTTVASGVLTAQVPSGAANPWDALFGQNDVVIQSGSHYTLTIVAWADRAITVPVGIQKVDAPHTGYFNGSLPLTTSPQTFVLAFDASVDDPAAGFQFKLGGLGAVTLYVDSVSLQGPAAPPPPPVFTIEELLINSDFDAGLNPWWNGGLNLSAGNGVLTAGVTSPGTNPWDRMFGQKNVPLYTNANYTLTIVAWASQPVTILAQLQLDGTPYTQYFGSDVPLTTSPLTYTFHFTSAYADPSAGFQFQMGARGVYTAYFDKVSLVGPKPAPNVVIIPPLRANQVGYLTHAPKIATYYTAVTTTLPWALKDAACNVVASGTTTVFGLNSASNETVQLVDFSAYVTPGVSYTLDIDGKKSHPFDIGDNVYQQLGHDALHYFYETRAGIAITLPYVSDLQWARAAGHVNVAPNQGDADVPCFNQKDLNDVQYIGCNYTLTVTKGWYDAGDHGKYVVNGGIAVWTLLNQYERAKYRGDLAALADGTLNIPEQSNGVPDILDEARWELEFMLDMQVPLSGTVEGRDLSYMAHHKLHDVVWTGLPMNPADDPQPRYLYPPSTAATLNLVATAAQCARIWQSIDAAFANRCLTAAQQAWDAAVAHPTEIARDIFTGGGAYNDDKLSDEFYWAATELYITTGNAKYLTPTVTSPYFKQIPIVAGPISGTGVITGSAISWGDTAALGTLSLALVPSNLPVADVNQARANIVEVAQGYVQALNREGYRLPYAPEAAGYPWGSSSAVLSNMLVVAYAYDFSHDVKYLNAVSLGMDYLLGRNPNDKSYVSGYGENPLQNPHHRFWAKQANASFPPPPPGVVSGGPNNGLQDPYIQSLYPNGCPSYQTCYVDHFQSYSTNEVAINWNAPLAWALGFLNDNTAFKDALRVYLPIVRR